MPQKLHITISNFRIEDRYFSSSSYICEREMYSIYSSTKIAVVNYAQEITDGWADDGIRVNVINPQRTMIPMRLRPFGEEPIGTL